MGGGDQACGFDDGQAAHVPIQPGTSPTLSAARIVTGAIVCSFSLLDRLLDRYGRIERGRGGVEQGHEPIAEALDEHRSVRGRECAQEQVMTPEMIIGQFFAEPGPRAESSRRCR